MTRCNLLGLLSFLAVLSLVQSPAAFAATCTTTTLASLETSGGCTMGDLSFSSFSLSNIGGDTVAPSAVNVAPISSEPLGLTFSLETPAGTGTTFLAINFLVSGPNTITDLEISTLGFSGSATGAVENACIGSGNTFNGSGGCSLTPSAYTHSIVTGYGGGHSGSYTFSPVSAVDLSTGFIFDNGTPVSITEQISETPATPLPAALPLFATGLGAMGLLGWRRKRKNAALAA